MGEGDQQMLKGWSYDVFLSFYGKDTRKNFTDHLYHALRSSGIHTFRDDVELPMGRVIGSELEEAIESSKILVVVFSKNYASSTWCLNELLYIMKCSKHNLQQLFFPIFLDVDPSDIRRQKGTVAESFAKHESRFPADKVQSWRVALMEAANISGHDLKNRYEAECIQEIIREILKKLDNTHLTVASYPVGITSHIKHIFPLLSIGSDDVRVIGICGMGGIGKTTIAKAVYNEFSHFFEGKSFLADFRGYVKKPEGKIHLRQQLFADILRIRDVEFNFVRHALKERFQRKRVLVIIDDVEDLSQLNLVAIDLGWFGPGSRIIITTRNKNLLEQHEANALYFPEELNADESLELLSWHAFRASEPPEEFLRVSRNVVKYCGGLPLAVEVLGAFLFKRSILEWESTLELLERTPDDTIQEKLRISFDALSNVQKDIFLDIACFFIGMDKDYVSHILDGCGFYPCVGLSVLMERCLVTVYDNKLMMHDLIRDMGREIVKKESPKCCGKRSRLWHPDDVIDVLNKCSGTDAVEGLSLNAQGQDVRKLDAKSFSTFRELRFLQLSCLQLKGSYEHFPKGLRSLCWHGFSLESIPANLCLQNLAFMDMQYSNLRQLWKAREAQHLEKLKFLDLSHSIWIRETPNFYCLPSLEKLLLIGCKSLVFVHESIGIHCDKLVLVNLKGCIELENLPRNFYNLKSLETLVLSGCSKLKKLDDALGKMEALETLLVDCTDIREVPSSIIQLKKLQNLSLCGSKRSWNDYMHSRNCPRPKLHLPGSLRGLSCLTTLRLSCCNLNDEMLPKDLGSVSCLKELDLSGNSFRNPQTDFASLPNLHSLKLNNCSKLQTILNLPRTLRSLVATNCVSLERTPDLSECSCLSSLLLTDCINLVETPGLDKRKQSMSSHVESCHCMVDTTNRESFLEEGSHMSGYGGMYHLGSGHPNCLRIKNERTYSFYFTVPEIPRFGLKEFTLYAPGINEHCFDLFDPTIEVTNHNRGISWVGTLSADVAICLPDGNIVCGCCLLDDSFLRKGDLVEVDVIFTSELSILEMGFTLSEVKEVLAVSLSKSTIAYLDSDA